MKKEKPNVITSNFIANYFQIDTDEAKIVFSKMERIVYDNNAVIVTIGEKADGLYFIDDGQATVLNESGEAVNEMNTGQYFGEYAILADEPRLSTVKAHGKVVAYRMKPEDFIALVGKNPKITGRLLKQTYSQISQKHTRLVSLTKKSRGVMWSPDDHKDTKTKGILITYGITILVFIITCLLAPHISGTPVWWQLLPIVFLMAFTLRTRRIIEGMLLTVMLLGGMLYSGNFLVGFGDMMIEGIGNPDTAETIVIMAMVEAVAALLASAGIVSAFKKLAKKHVKTKTGSLLGMLLIMIVVCLDECLNVITAGFCMNDEADRYKVPRETRALLGSFSTGICAVIPFSLWSAYICGWVSMYFDKGKNMFLKSIPYNLAGIVSLTFALMLCFGILPRTKQIKEAYLRIKQGGKLWPDGSEKYFEIDDVDEVVGKPVNLILPMAVWSVSAVVCGLIRNPGDFALDPVSGLIITIIFMFFLYVGQKLMSPKAFFETMSEGIGNALMPILLLILAERISACLEELCFDEYLVTTISTMVGGKLFLVPMVIFVLCTLICLGLGSCWGMYGLGIPISLYLSSKLGLNVPLCLGAALAAGIIGESLCPYMDDTAPSVTVIGCGPVHYRKLRIQYWIPIAVICMVGYIMLGLLVG